MRLLNARRAVLPVQNILEFLGGTAQRFAQSNRDVKNKVTIFEEFNALLPRGHCNRARTTRAAPGRRALGPQEQSLRLVGLGPWVRPFRRLTGGTHLI
jgi:hypothetical protein